MSRLTNITQTARAQASTAQTDQTLVAAPGTGLSIRVHSIFGFSAAAGTITLESGTATRMFEFYPGANGGVSAGKTDPEDPIFVCAANQALTWTSTITGAHYIHVNYTVV